MAAERRGELVKRRIAIWCALVLALFRLPVASHAQTDRFFYDNLGRLAVVIATNGTNAAFYDYDAVGNITAIRTQTVSAVNLFVYSLTEFTFLSQSMC